MVGRLEPPDVADGGGSGCLPSPGLALARKSGIGNEVFESVAGRITTTYRPSLNRSEGI